ncbi:hypothetical protein HDU93_003253 [Gonapodya sp. JEL0774]|nr:hypothetical protein HDU93_003253 [Gonapodya sp. JEL0774]
MSLGSGALSKRVPEAAKQREFFASKHRKTLMQAYTAIPTSTRTNRQAPNLDILALRRLADVVGRTVADGTTKRQVEEDDEKGALQVPRDRQQAKTTRRESLRVGTADDEATPESIVFIETAVPSPGVDHEGVQKIQSKPRFKNHSERVRTPDRGKKRIMFDSDGDLFDRVPAGDPETPTTTKSSINAFTKTTVATPGSEQSAEVASRAVQEESKDERIARLESSVSSLRLQLSFLRDDLRDLAARVNDLPAVEGAVSIADSKAIGTNAGINVGCQTDIDFEVTERRENTFDAAGKDKECRNIAFTSVDVNSCNATDGTETNVANVVQVEDEGHQRHNISVRKNFAVAFSFEKIDAAMEGSTNNSSVQGVRSDVMLGEISGQAEVGLTMSTMLSLSDRNPVSDGGNITKGQTDSVSREVQGETKCDAIPDEVACAADIGLNPAVLDQADQADLSESIDKENGEEIQTDPTLQEVQDEGHSRDEVVEPDQEETMEFCLQEGQPTMRNGIEIIRRPLPCQEAKELGAYNVDELMVDEVDERPHSFDIGVTDPENFQKEGTPTSEHEMEGVQNSGDGIRGPDEGRHRIPPGLLQSRSSIQTVANAQSEVMDFGERNHDKISGYLENTAFTGTGDFTTPEIHDTKDLERVESPRALQEFILGRTDTPNVAAQRTLDVPEQPDVEVLATQCVPKERVVAERALSNGNVTLHEVNFPNTSIPEPGSDEKGEPNQENSEEPGEPQDEEIDRGSTTGAKKRNLPLEEVPEQLVEVIKANERVANQRSPVPSATSTHSAALFRQFIESDNGQSSSRGPDDNYSIPDSQMEVIVAETSQLGVHSPQMPLKPSMNQVLVGETSQVGDDGTQVSLFLALYETAPEGFSGQVNAIFQGIESSPPPSSQPAPMAHGVKMQPQL